MDNHLTLRFLPNQRKMSRPVENRIKMIYECGLWLLEVMFEGPAEGPDLDMNEYWNTSRPLRYRFTLTTPSDQQPVRRSTVLVVLTNRGPNDVVSFEFVITLWVPGFIPSVPYDKTFSIESILGGIAFPVRNIKIDTQATQSQATRTRVGGSAKIKKATSRRA